MTRPLSISADDSDQSAAKEYADGCDNESGGFLSHQLVAIRSKAFLEGVKRERSRLSLTDASQGNPIHTYFNSQKREISDVSTDDSGLTNKWLIKADRDLIACQKGMKKLRNRCAQLEVLLAEIAPSWLPEDIRNRRREALSPDRLGVAIPDSETEL